MTGVRLADPAARTLTTGKTLPVRVPSLPTTYHLCLMGDFLWQYGCELLHEILPAFFYFFYSVQAATV